MPPWVQNLWESKCRGFCAWGCWRVQGLGHVMRVRPSSERLDQQMSAMEKWRLYFGWCKTQNKKALLASLSCHQGLVKHTGGKCDFSWDPKNVQRTLNPLLRSSSGLLIFLNSVMEWMLRSRTKDSQNNNTDLSWSIYLSIYHRRIYLSIYL